MSAQLAAALQHVIDGMNDAGIKTAADPADVDIPGGLVYPSLIDYEFIDSEAYTMTVDVFLIAGSLRNLHALDQLDDLLGRLRGVFPVGEVRAVTVNLASQSPDPLPALQTSVLVSVSLDESE